MSKHSRYLMQMGHITLARLKRGDTSAATDKQGRSNGDRMWRSNQNDLVWYGKGPQGATGGKAPKQGTLSWYGEEGSSATNADKISAWLKAEYAKEGINSRADMQNLINQGYAEKRYNAADVIAMQKTADYVYGNNPQQEAAYMLQAKAKTSGGQSYQQAIDDYKNRQRQIAESSSKSSSSGGSGAAGGITTGLTTAATIAGKYYMTHHGTGTVAAKVGSTAATEGGAAVAGSAAAESGATAVGMTSAQAGGYAGVASLGTESGTAGAAGFDTFATGAAAESSSSTAAGGAALGSTAGIAVGAGAALVGLYLSSQHIKDAKARKGGENLNFDETADAMSPEVHLGLSKHAWGINKFAMKYDPVFRTIGLGLNYLMHPSTKQIQAARWANLRENDPNYAAWEGQRDASYALQGYEDRAAQAQTEAYGATPDNYQGWYANKSVPGWNSFVNKARDNYAASKGWKTDQDYDLSDKDFQKTLGTGDVMFQPWMFENFQGWGQLSNQQREAISQAAISSGTMSSSKGMINFEMNDQIKNAAAMQGVQVNEQK